ncbi:HesA/MoeB/ThiF family protein [Roseovarius sp. SCSIO 43702]|uniref:HesA/MoeB/ThiF family protein n=1 Tax=Roseovarius sp. SCSIO 43702 TaxID=2823043 RepID=UPI001C731F27|nr:HesA/MoeB/ThiF family protein [Roseovarius sp. SCSIO 43702]QYX57642.1 HesA/MoeB/ThiF family protein [Roseovarius sp. SCSIO 43702]
MLLVLGMAVAIWGLGALVGAPPRTRGVMITCLWLGVILLHALLPAGHPLRQATGETAVPWVMLAGAAALAFAYFTGVGWLRRKVRARERETGARDEEGGGRLFSEAELDRYARHIVLREVGGPGQKRLKEARVMVVGAGGLGAPVLTYLAAAGVGRIGVIDHDEVSQSNLQRQVIFRDDQTGMPKVFAAQASVAALNPHVELRPYHRRLTEEIAADLFAEYDLVLDGTDNFETRFLTNRAAVAAGRPLVSGAMSQWEGQVSVFDPAQGAPCYQCIFPEAPAEGLAPSCAEAGIIGPLPGVVGSIMAVEAIKVITGAGAPLRGEMLIYDGLYGESRKFALARREDCPVCGGAA